MDPGFCWRLDWGNGPFPRSSQRQSLIDAIAADPHDASLREVYQDLAIEEGDPHGEFVRVWRALEERLATRPLHPSVHGFIAPFAPMDDDVRDLLDAANTLYARYGRGFFPRVFATSVGRALPQRTTIAGGFLAALDAKRDQDLAKLFPLAPLVVVRAPTFKTPLPTSVRGIRKVTPALLDAHQGPLDTLDIEAISASEREQRWRRRLAETNNAEVPDALLHPTLAQVKRLTCDVMEGPPVLASVVPRWTKLEHLSVHGVLTAQTLDALGELPALRSLSVSSLAHPLNGFGALRSLRCGLPYGVSADVASSISGLNLERLLCRSDGTHDHRFERLIPRLKVLHADRRIAPLLTQLLQRENQMTSLTLGSDRGRGLVLRFGGLALNGAGALALFGIDDNDLITLAKSESRGVRRLRVGSAPLYPGTIRALADASWIHDVEYLTIEMQRVNEEIVGELFSAMPKLRGLRCKFKHPKRNTHLRVLTARPDHRVEHLEILYGDPEGAIAFLKSPAAQKVRRLALLDDDREIERALLESPHLSALHVLQLPNHKPSAALEARFGHRIHAKDWEGPLA